MAHFLWLARHLSNIIKLQCFESKGHPRNLIPD